jgi:signal transduction histidine kinase
MHDSLAQLLGYVNTKAQAVQELLDQGQAERATGQLRQLAEAARAAYADVREAILGLRTSVGADQSLLGALRDYVEQWGEQAGIRAELIEGDQESVSSNLAPAAEVQLLRIVQEALTNVRKHSSATHARVHLCMADGALEVSIEDDGVGFDPSAPGRGLQPRFGLATMRERAEAIGGELMISSAPGKGARLTARIPLASPEIPWGS